MTCSRRTIRPSPARRIFSNIDTGQRSLNSLRPHRRRPATRTAARVRGIRPVLRDRGRRFRCGRTFVPLISCHCKTEDPRTGGTAESRPMDGIDAGAVRLRLPTADDIPDVVTGCNDPLTRRFLPFLPHPYTLRDGEKFVTETSPSFWAERGGS